MATTNDKLTIDVLRSEGFCGFVTFDELRESANAVPLSGGIYVPAEIYELTRSITWIKLTALALNALIVIYMCRVLWRTRRGQFFKRG